MTIHHQPFSKKQVASQPKQQISMQQNVSQNQTSFDSNMGEEKSVEKNWVRNSKPTPQDHYKAKPVL